MLVDHGFRSDGQIVEPRAGEIKPIYQSMKLRTGGGIDYAFAGIIISREHSVHSCIKCTVHYGAHGLAGNWGYCEQEKAVLCTTHSCSPRT